MKFFVPGYDDQGQAFDWWENARKQRGKTHFPTTEEKIFKIYYSRNQQNVAEQVGERSPITGEPVLAILESISPPVFLILTDHDTRMVGMDRGPSVESFEDFDPH